MKLVQHFTKSIIIIAFAITFLSACNNSGNPQEVVQVPTATPPPDCVPPTGDIRYNTTEAVAGEELIFVADIRGDDLGYLWTAVSGIFTDPETKIATYVAPDDITEDTIILSISSACGEIEKTLQISIIPSTATPTAKPSPTNDATATLTITPDSTPTHTPRPQGTPTATATEEFIAMPPVNLAEPKDNTCVGGGSATFRWEWDWVLNDVEGSGGDYFALNIWSNSTENRSATWIKTNYYTVNRPEDPIVVYTQNVDCTQEGGCFWNVNVIRAKVPPGQGHLPNSHAVIAKSPTRNFCVNGDGIIPPIDTPVPPTGNPEKPTVTPVTPPSSLSVP